MEFLDNYYT